MQNKKVLLVTVQEPDISRIFTRVKRTSRIKLGHIYRAIEVYLATSPQRESEELDFSHSSVTVTFTTAANTSWAHELCLELRYSKAFESPSYIYIYIYYGWSLIFFQWASCIYIYIYVCVCVCVCVCVWLNDKDSFCLYNFFTILSRFLISVLFSGWNQLINLPKLSRALSDFS